MKRFQFFLVLSILLLTVTDLYAQQSTFDVVMSGKVCTVSKNNQQIDCEYRVGNGLHFTIAGIGLPDTAITFMQSSFEGDYYATYGMMHGCVIVKRGFKDWKGEFLDFAFVSPRNGKVYRDWPSCKEGL